MRRSRWVSHALLTLGAVGLFGCQADPGGPPTPLGAASGTTLQTVRVDGVNLALHPEGRALAPSGWTQKTIGATGGSISTDGATLSVPPGALLLPTSITMMGRTDPTWKYKFGPSGLQFLAPAMLEIAVDVASLGVDPARLKVAGSDDEGLLWEIVDGSGYDPLRGVIVAPILHFSQYAICVE